MGLNACSCLRNYDDLSDETDLNGEGEIVGFSIPNNHFLFSNQEDSVNLTGAERMSYLMKVNTYDSGTIKNTAFCTLKTGTAVERIQSVFRGSSFRKKFLKKKIELLNNNNEKIEEKNEINLINTNRNENNENDFIPEKTKKAEKNFEEKLDYEKGWEKYIIIDINDELKSENSKGGKFSQQNYNDIIKNNTNLISTKEEGDFITINNEICLFKGLMENKKDKKNNLTGKGELYFKNGSKYEGIFINGKLNGLGRYIDDKSVCFEGLFKNGILEGRGTKIQITEDGSKKIYEGDLKNYIREGNGVIKCKNYTYDGEFVNDKKQGKGKLIYNENGNIYEGEFNNDDINGYGTYTFSNKHIYQGQFYNGLFHGKGMYKWPDGCYFNGEYVHGVREGMGEYKFTNGKIYEGPFTKGKPNGKGIIKSGGKNYKCEFENGKLLTDIKSFINNRSRTKNVSI